MEMERRRVYFLFLGNEKKHKSCQILNLQQGNAFSFSLWLSSFFPVPIQVFVVNKFLDQTSHFWLLLNFTWFCTYALWPDFTNIAREHNFEEMSQCFVRPQEICILPSQYNTEEEAGEERCHHKDDFPTAPEHYCRLLVVEHQWLRGL